MPNYSELYRVFIEDKYIRFENKKKILLEYDNNNMFYQLLKYLYYNHNDTPADMKSADSFCVTTKIKGKETKIAEYEENIETIRYTFPSPVIKSDTIDSISQWQNILDKKLVSQLKKAIKEIATYNIRNQVLIDTEEKTAIVSAQDATLPANGTCRVKIEPTSLDLSAGYEATLYRSSQLIKDKIEIADSILKPGLNNIVSLDLINKSEEAESKPKEPVFHITKGDTIGTMVHGLIPFEKLENVRHNTGRDRKGLEKYLPRKTKFTKSVISPDIDFNGKGPSKMRLMLLAYALKMSAKETLALLQSVGTNPSINIWNGYDAIIFYAIARKNHDITLNDLDNLGLIMTNEDEDDTIVDPLPDNMTDTDNAWNSFNSLIEMSKESSLREIEKLLLRIKKVNKIYSVKVKEELDSMFKYVMKESKRIFQDNYWEKCDPGNDTNEISFRKCRNAITEQFWPYYENQVQYRQGVFTTLQLMKSLPNKNHLKNVDDGTQAVTKADLEFAFFLKFVLENPLTDYGKLEDIDIENTLGQRFKDYRLQADTYMTKYHFTQIHDMDPFDSLLLVCMQKEFPIKTLHAIAKQYFNIKGDAKIKNI